MLGFLDSFLNRSIFSLLLLLLFGVALFSVFSESLGISLNTVVGTVRQKEDQDQLPTLGRFQRLRSEGPFHNICDEKQPTTKQSRNETK